jgi:hypothetical protein
MAVGRSEHMLRRQFYSSLGLAGTSNGTTTSQSAEHDRMEKKQ